MLAYAAKRILLGMAILLVVMGLLFSMLHLIPGDPGVIALGQHATPEMRRHFRDSMGLDLPLPVQYLRFLLHVAEGDLGSDVWSGAPVAGLIRAVAPNTLVLAGASLAWSVAFGVLFGTLAATHRHRWQDWLVGVCSVAFVGAPTFLVALVLLLVFAVRLNWFPAIGAGDPADPLGQARALVLPSVAVGLGWVGYIARLVRGTMSAALEENYVRTFRAFGVDRRRIVGRYVLREVMVAVVPVVAVGLGGLLSGSVFAEIVFQRPGLGTLIYHAVSDRNYPVVMGAVLVTTALYVGAMVLADLVVAVLDPRVRSGL
jgi:peptide/nickel transport system permease protein